MLIRDVKRISVAVEMSSDHRATKMAAVLTRSILDTMSLGPTPGSAALCHQKISTWMASRI
jgi:hypothetical protein